MFEKLTENLNKSQLHGKTLQEEINSIASQILQTKISISNISQTILQSKQLDKDLAISIKKNEQEQSNYQYQKQKIQIRLKQAQRKIQIQENLYQKKIQYNQNLKKKIQNLQKSIKENSFDDQTLELSKCLQELETKQSRQGIALHNLHSQLSSLSIKTRSLESKLFTLKNNTKAKKKVLQKLQQQLSFGDKQNVNENEQLQRCKKIQELQKFKNTAVKICDKKNAQVKNFIEEFEQLRQNTCKIKQQLEKMDELSQQIRIETMSKGVNVSNLGVQFSRPVSRKKQNIYTYNYSSGININRSRSKGKNKSVKFI